MRVNVLVNIKKLHSKACDYLYTNCMRNWLGNCTRSAILDSLNAIIALKSIQILG